MRKLTFSAGSLTICLMLQSLAAQQREPMGTVPTTDARVNGQVEVRAGEARLLSNVSVTAFDRTAPIALGRGGDVMVCSTSEFHLLRAPQGVALIFGLDRGALELHSLSQPGDIVITPDLKLTPVTKGRYDLRLRVTREGDTCIDNGGSDAPVLNATDAFSTSSYRVLPGQHLLFVKGDLHQVVDHERSPCGCPSANPQTLAGQSPAAAAHPFPQAESQGLAPTVPTSNAASVGTASSQVTTSFQYNNGQGTPPPGGTSAVSGSGTTPAGAITPGTTASSPAKEEGSGFGGALRRFFRKIFHTHS